MRARPHIEPLPADHPAPPHQPQEMKLVYIKRWRTIVSLPEKYASEIVEALRNSVGPTERLQCLRCGTVDAFGAVSAEKK